MALRNCFCAVLIGCLWVGSSWANRYSEPYSCHGDVCNLDPDAQFCDMDYMLCRRCNDVREDCFTRLHICNCSQFCTEYIYRRDIEKQRVEGCMLPPPPVHGRYNVNTTRVPIGAKLEVTCTAGYTVRNDYLMTCSNFSMWTGSLSTCTASHIDWKDVLMITVGVGLVISVVLNVIFANQCHMNKIKTKVKKRQANNIRQLYSLEELKMGAKTKDAMEENIGHNSKRKRLLPSAPDEHSIDIESTRKTDNNPDEEFLPRKHNSDQDGSRGSTYKSDANSISVGQSNAESNTLNGSRHNPGCSFSNNQSVSLVLNLNNVTPPMPPKIIAKQENLSTQQPDKYPTPETHNEDAHAFAKSMGTIMQPDISTTGPVVQPEDIGENAMIAVGRSEFPHDNIYSRSTVASS